jgi:hypothetical protein
MAGVERITERVGREAPVRRLPDMGHFTHRVQSRDLLEFVIVRSPFYRGGLQEFGTIRMPPRVAPLASM